MAQNIPAVPPIIDSSNTVSTGDTATLDHFIYNPVTRQLEADVAIQTTLNSLYLGVQHKMSSGAENIFFTNMGNQTNFYPMWGGLKDQSLVVNQGASGFIPPSGRVYTDMFSLPLGGNPDPLTSIGYSGDNYFAVSIAGLGITTVAAESVAADIDLVYKLTVNGRQVYEQRLPRAAGAAAAINPGDTIEWFFDHPVEIHAGTTIFAKIEKVTQETQIAQGTFQVRAGDDGTGRYWATVHNRLFTDKDLELISPYLKYEAMDFGADATGSSLLLRDLTLAAPDTVLTHYNVNELEAVANGANIRIKVKNGQKVIVEALPVAAASIDGTLVNAVLNLALVELNTLFTNALSFASAGGNPVSAFVLSGDDLTLTLDDGTSFTVDVTTLGVDENKFVASGALVGSDLVLTMTDASVVTIDASNLVSGSTLSAVNDRWYISYGTNANNAVEVSTNDSTINQQLPFYFGQVLTRGDVFSWNFQSNGGSNLIIGIWDGAEVATPYNGGSVTASNWGTSFTFAGGFTAGSNSTLTNTNSGAKYAVSNGSPLEIRFDDQGFLTLVDVSVSPEIEIAKTTIALGVNEFNLQMHTWANGVLPNGIISTSGWEIVHDFAGTEAGVLNGILDHTVIKSKISVAPGEKLMFMLDEVGAGDFFGTDYTNAATGVATAEEQLSNTFVYQTNEALVLTVGGTTDWVPNTSAAGYFFAASLHQYRVGGASTVQGMHSIRYYGDNTIQLWDEDLNVEIATATAQGDGSPIFLYFGVKGNRAYYTVPVISKQTIGQGSQPDINFTPTVADQTFTVTTGTTLNAQLVSTGNIVNQWAELDAPAWMTLNQSTGVLTGTVPAFTGTAADTIVVNCKAGNAIGGTVEFTATVTVAQVSYTNTNSLKFSNGTSAYLQGNPLNVPSLARAANGSGSADAWSISMWVKPSSTSSTNQTLFYYGDDDITNGGRIEIMQLTGANLLVRYGSASNYLAFICTGNFNLDAWNHILVTYNGGLTGVNQADIGTYLTNFTVSLNGANGISQVSHGNYGYSGAIVSDFFRVGRLIFGANSQYLKDGIVNQLAIWGSDQSANLAAIYNSGATHDLSLLAAPPSHFYEITTSTTTIPDLAGSAPLTGYNFSASDLVTDAP